jgi:RNA polymerase sigma factor for flagellar operon FliA
MNLAEAQSWNRTDGGLEARNALVAAYLPQVKRIVQRIAVHLPASVELEDLIHVGVIGLIQAIERYDPERDNTFMTFAAFRIRGAVLSELRDRDYLSRSSRRKVREMERTQGRLEQLLGRQASDAEVADALEIDLEQLQGLRQLASLSFISLDEISPTPNEEREQLVDALVYGDEDGDGLTVARLKELRSGLARAIGRLSAKEQMVLSLYYEQELTMKEAGKVLDLTESRVSQIHSRAVLRLREMMTREGLI